MTEVLRIVAIGSATGTYGGPFDTAVNQARIGSGAGHHVNVLCGHFADDAPLGRKVGGSSVRSLIPSLPFVTAFSSRLALKIWKAVRRAHVVHISFAREAIPVFSLLVARLTGTSVILQPHGMLTSRTSRKHALVDLPLRNLARASKIVIALTDVEAEQLRAWFGASCPPLMILGNPTPLLDGRDHMSLLDEDGGPPELLWLARLHPRKRVSVFGQAARTAKREGLNWDFCVVGPDGGELPLLLEMVSELSRSPGPGRLRYEGAIPGAEVAQRVSKCQVFVLTADSEPWGNVLVLAISLGKPCVVPESSALATVVREFGAGIVVPDDEPNAVVRAVSEILSEHRYGSFVDGCRELAARHFSDAYQRQRLDALYRSFSPRA